MSVRPENLNRLVECCICCDYLTDVRETPCCHQLFCLNCIDFWLKTSSKTCPRCRANDLTKEKLLNNIVVQRFVDDLLFDCPFKTEGCPAQVPRVDLEIHKNSCSFAPDRLAAKRRENFNKLSARLTEFRRSKKTIDDQRLYELAELFYLDKYFDSARETIRLMKKNDSQIKFIVLQAKIESEDGKFQRAEELFRSALSKVRQHDENIEIRNLYGKLLFQLARFPEAKQKFQEATDALKPSDSPQLRAQILNKFPFKNFVRRISFHGKIGRTFSLLGLQNISTKELREKTILVKLRF